jgi:hypothetical protein
MAAIDDFAKLLFDEAKAFLEKGRDATLLEAQTAYFHASLLLGFCALEAHLNSIADDFFTTRSDLSLLDKSILEEKEIELKDGEYILTNRIKMFRLEDRIEYLSRRFAGKVIDKSAAYWTDFKEAIRLRNNLTHPKVPPTIDAGSVQRALTAILELLNVLYRDIYRVKGYPGYNRGLDTAMTF